MSTLTLTPKHWFSWDFDVSDGARQLVDIRLSRWRERGVLSADGVDYTVYRESLLGDFVLEHAGSTLARATKPSAFHRMFVITYKEKPYTLRAESAFRRAFIVLDGSAEVGSIVPETMWGRRATVSLPDDWPLPLKSFAIWLTVVHWKREAS
jgi:hypothetical protein